MNINAKALLDGHLVAFPTETVYGIGADATNPAAVARIYQVKGRPSEHPLIVHVADFERIDQWILNIPEYAVMLGKEFWPGPMTLILPRSHLAKDFIKGGQDTVGIRVPDNSGAIELLNAFHNLGGAGVAAPSANRFGQVSPTTAAAVKEELGDYLLDTDLILDGGQSRVGLESTIIDCTEDSPRILRPGAITKNMVENIAGRPLAEFPSKPHESNNRSAIRVSGSLDNHYSPRARVVLDEKPRIGCGFIALDNLKTPAGVFRLSSPRSIEEFARDLYSALREGDQKELEYIFVAQPDGDGLAEAIRDRLSRSAKGR